MRDGARGAVRLAAAAILTGSLALLVAPGLAWAQSAPADQSLHIRGVDERAFPTVGLTVSVGGSGSLSLQDVEEIRRSYELFADTGRFEADAATDDFVWDMSRFTGWPE